MGGGNVVHAIAEKICSITDPFCPAARGAKWPDEASARTVPITLEGLVTVTTDANGNAAVAFLADLPNGYFIAAAIDNATAEVTDWGTVNPLAGATEWSSTDPSHRLVSGGIVFTSTTSMMTSQGVMRVQERPGTTVSDTDITLHNLDSLLYGPVVDQNLRVNTPLTGIHRFTDVTGRQFKTYDTSETSDPENLDADGKSILVCSIRGGPPSTTVGLIRYVYHQELSFSTNTVWNKVATKAAGDSPDLKRAVNHVTTVVEPVQRGGETSFGQLIMNKAGDFLVNNLGKIGGGIIGAVFGDPYSGMQAGAVFDAGHQMMVANQTQQKYLTVD